MAKYNLKRKLFTRWDETDRLKQMTDSDILAEKKKKQNIGSNIVDTGMAAGKTALTGLGVGAGIGAASGFLGKASGFGSRMSGVGKGMMKWGKRGAIAGAVIGAGSMIGKQMKKANDNEFYNDRLEYAQNQARRREKKDWKQNMTQRDGYTY